MARWWIPRPTPKPKPPASSVKETWATVKSGSTISGTVVSVGEKYGVYAEYVNKLKLGPLDLSGFQFGMKLAKCDDVLIDSYKGRKNVMGLHLKGCSRVEARNLDQSAGKTKNDHCLYLDDGNRQLRFIHGILKPTSGYGIHAFMESGESDGLYVEDYIIDCQLSLRGAVVLARWKNVEMRLMHTVAWKGQTHYHLYGTVSHVIVEGFSAEGGDSLVGLASNTGYPTDVIFRNGFYHGKYLTPGGKPIPGVTFENVQLT
jgi:hypothetical protein